MNGWVQLEQAEDKEGEKEEGEVKVAELLSKNSVLFDLDKV